METEWVLPSERLQAVHSTLREALVRAASPRLLTALAPVLVAHANELQLRVVESQLLPLGLSHRLGWLVENTVAALQELASKPSSAKVVARYRRASVVLSSWLEAKGVGDVPKGLDVLDTSIRSEKSRSLVQQRRTPISVRWGVLSELTVADFEHAIEAAREAG